MINALSRPDDGALARKMVESLIVSAKWAPEDLAGRRLILRALSGRRILVDGTEGRLSAGDAEVLSVDATPSNGVIYEIDSLTLCADGDD